MRGRITFVAGLAIGLVAGARAGRERYDQLMRLTHKVANNPTVRKATSAAGQKAGELSKAAGHQAAEKLPKITEQAKQGASKVRGQLNHSNEPEDVLSDFQ
jgi:vacuolar-type H+-ATPase subunit H